MKNILISASSAGGCGCKAPNDMLSTLLRNANISGTQRDDAAVIDIQKSSSNNLLASIDYGGPIVSNGHDWGRIVAAHAHSDTFAMGGSP